MKGIFVRFLTVRSMFMYEVLLSEGFNGLLRSFSYCERGLDVR